MKFFIFFLASFVLFWPNQSLAFDPFYGQSFATEQILARYQSGQVRILIVPGHSQFEGGAEFGALAERELNVLIARELADFLRTDKRLNILVTRELDGSLAPWLSAYLGTFEKQISDFRVGLSKTILSDPEGLTNGLISPKIQRVYHPTASPRNAFELYGINKFANDNKIDLVLHLHLNDYGSRRVGEIGKYSGFAVYVPAGRLANSAASFNLAEKISARLSQMTGQSDLPGEAGGVVPDEELIAIGSNASRAGPSVLIEYGYLYEPQFRDGQVRPVYLRELAHQTNLAILDYLGADSASQKPTSLIFGWPRSLKKGDSGADVLSLQFFLKEQGFYPPPGKNIVDCPINGRFGPCTHSAVVSFQEKHRGEILAPNNLIFGTGFVGPATLKTLNSLAL